MTEPDPRRETEEAARTGRFPDDDGGLRDDSTPVEREVPPEDVDDATLRLNEAYPLNDKLRAEYEAQKTERTDRKSGAP
jgi:hypothetical protein